MCDDGKLRNMHTRTKSQNKGKAGLVCSICEKKSAWRSRQGYDVRRDVYWLAGVVYLLISHCMQDNHHHHCGNENGR